MALRKTITELQHRDQDNRQILADKDAFIQRWREDISELYTRIKEDLLKEYIEDQSINFREMDCKVTEQALGDYIAKALIMLIADREVAIYPTARMTRGFSGVLAMRRPDRTSEYDKVQIVRNRGEDLWYIQNKTATDAVNPMRPLSLGLGAADLFSKKDYVYLEQMTLENALDFLLLL